MGKERKVRNFKSSGLKVEKKCNYRHSIYLFLSTYNLYYQYIFIGQVYYPYVIIDTVIICSYQ